MIKKLLNKLFGCKTIQEELLEFKYLRPIPEKTKAGGMEIFLKKLRGMDDQRRWYLLNSSWKPSYVDPESVEDTVKVVGWKSHLPDDNYE